MPLHLHFHTTLLSSSCIYLFILFISSFSIADAQDLRVGVLLGDPFASYNSSNSTYYGFGVDFWNMVVDNMNTNLNYDINTTFVTVDSMYDMVNMLFLNQVDIAIYGIIPPPNVYRMLNSSLPYLGTVLHTVSLVSSSEKTTFQIMWDVVIDATFLGIVLIICLFSIFAAHVIWAIERSKNDGFDRSYKYGIGSSIYWAWSTISLVGFGDINPKSPTGKGFTVFVVLVSLVFLNMYSGIVCAYVTTNSLEPNPPTRDAFTGLYVAALNNSYAVYFLQIVNAQIIQVANLSDGITLVQNGTVNYLLSDQASLLRYNNSDPTIEISGPSFDNVNFTFLYSSALSKQFSMDMDRAITLLQFTQAYSSLKSTYFSFPNSSPPPDPNNSFIRVWIYPVVFMGVIVLFVIWMVFWHFAGFGPKSSNPSDNKNSNNDEEAPNVPDDANMQEVGPSTR